MIVRSTAIPNAGFEAKTFGRPKQFDGTEAQWRDWSFAFMAYCTVLDAELGRLMKAVHDREELVDPNTLRQEHVGFSHNLYYMLAMVLTGSALTEIRHIPQQNGFEA